MAGRRRRRGDGEGEPHANHERWMLTYLDMITLLMVLFVVLYAMSTVDTQKFEQLRASLAGAFGGSQTLVSGGSDPSISTEGISPAAVSLQKPKSELFEGNPAATSDQAANAALQQAQRDK